MANEQVELVQEVRTGAAVQYLFETEIYFTREDAEEARAERVGVIARRFYQELPAALAGSKVRGRRSARERAAQRWSRRNDETLH
jgi:MoxR-like ATPase